MTELDLPKRLMVHLGAHKTASTHFHRLFLRNSKLCAAHDLAVPKKEPIRRLLTKKLVAHVDVDTLNPSAALAEMAEGHGNLFISDENIIGVPGGLFRKGQMYSNAQKKLERLNTVLASVDTTEVLLAVRHPASFVASSYGEYMRRSGYLTFEEYLHGMQIENIRWADLVKRAQAAMPDQPLVVWAFEDYRALVPRLLNRVLGVAEDTATDYKELETVVRPGMSHRAMQEIEKLCAETTGDVSTEALEAVVAAYPKSKTEPAPQVWTPEQRETLDALYARDLEAIGKMDGVELLS